MIKTIKWLGIGLVTLLLALTALVYLLTYHPKPVQAAALTCPDNTPVYTEAEPLKVISYNVQYMAGKDYVFFYDLLDNSGPDTKPSAESLETTLAGISELLLDLDADVVLLQELHEDHITSNYQNQTELLMAQLGDQYPCVSEAFYWKAGFVPLPEIMGSVGMKLVTLSKYKLENAQRHQLSLIPSDPVSQAFGLKRAVLTTEMPTANGSAWTLMNTHLDAFSQGTNTMEEQVAEVNAIIETVGERPWLIGGDFNLLADGQYEKLPDAQRAYYNPSTELNNLHDKYPSVPSLQDIQGPDSELWFTHFPNDPSVGRPDRTIDYIFYSPSLKVSYPFVQQGVALTLSDHLPIVGEFSRQ